ncbi:Alpha/Beta hydrolase protein [Cytidiella melzeri]|nr:Alpha/Beta hydrolase protein [Cytidiella melzeri]
MGNPEVLTKDSQSLYKQLAGLPTYKAGQFQASNILRVTSVTSDHERTVKRTSLKSYVLTGETTVASISPDNPEIVASVLSPSGKYVALLRESSDSTSAPDSKKRFVEIWAEDKIHASQEVTEVHGAFYTDESKPEEPESDPFAKYRFVPEFGESYGGKKRPSIFVFTCTSFESSRVAKITLTDSTSPPLLGHPVFGGEDTVFAAGYEYSEDHRLLGVIYCPNRQAGIWEITLPDNVQQGDSDVLKCDSSKLTSVDMACRSPRVFLDENGHPSQLVWISNAVGGPHATCSTLYARQLSSGETKSLVGSVRDPAPSEFPGLYLNTLPASPFVRAPGSSTSCIALSSIWRSRSVVLLILLADGNIVNLTPMENDAPYSWTVLCTDGKDSLLCTCSAPNRPPQLVLGNIGENSAVQWKVVVKPDISDDLREQLEGLKTEIIPVPGRDPTETIVLRKATQANQPSITMPHGGPHSPNTTQFSPTSAALAIEGYVVSYPGYTGSLGFGEKHVNALLGKIGTLDIEDCMASIRHLVTLGYTELGAGKQYLMGGSHGGFITAHLIGQYPDFFSGAVLRNPVISLGELSYSDIPDWYFEEAGIHYTPTSLVTPDLYEKLWTMSPISHVDKVRCPVVLMIGEKDQRVATTQGRSYYHAMKGRGKDVQMLCFKDDIHAIDSVDGTLTTYEVAKQLFGRTLTK